MRLGEWFRRLGEWFGRLGEWFRRLGEWFGRLPGGDAGAPTVIAAAEPDGNGRRRRLRAPSARGHGRRVRSRLRPAGDRGAGPLQPAHLPSWPEPTP